jgi:hypothetical protein
MHSFHLEGAGVLIYLLASKWRQHIPLKQTFLSTQLYSFASKKTASDTLHIHPKNTVAVILKTNRTIDKFQINSIKP